MKIQNETRHFFETCLDLHALAAFHRPGIRNDGSYGIRQAKRNTHEFCYGDYFRHRLGYSPTLFPPKMKQTNFKIIQRLAHDSYGCSPTFGVTLMWLLCNKEITLANWYFGHVYWAHTISQRIWLYSDFWLTVCWQWYPSPQSKHASTSHPHWRKLMQIDRTSRRKGQITKKNPGKLVLLWWARGQGAEKKPALLIIKR